MTSRDNLPPPQDALEGSKLSISVIRLEWRTRLGHIFRLRAWYLAGKTFLQRTANLKKIQDRQCRYNVTLRRVGANIVAVDNQWVLHSLGVRICSLMYPTCNAHATYGGGRGGKRHAPSALPAGKTRYPFYRRLGGPQGQSGQVRKISTLTGIRYPERPTRSESLYRLRFLGSFS